MNDTPNQTTMPTPSAPAPPAETRPVPVPLPRPIHLKKILVPLDFSEASRQALKYAVAFAAHFQASLVLLHVVEFNYVGSDFNLVETSQIETDLRAGAEQRLEDWLQQETSQQVPAEPMVKMGRPYHEIVETARENESDLILIATHGHSSLTHVLLGSTVERVVRYAPCPVLVVRPSEHEFV
jgi:universal stress protein A